MLLLAVPSTALLFRGMTPVRPMPRCNSPNDIAHKGELGCLTACVHDKRVAPRASAKKNRRNRHCEKQFTRHTLTHAPRGAPQTAAGTAAPSDGGAVHEALSMDRLA